MTFTFNKTTYVSTLFAAVLLSGCSTIPNSAVQTIVLDPAAATKAFDGAVIDAKDVESFEVSHALSDVSVDNSDLVWKFIDGQKYILVSSWKANASFYKPKPGSIYYNTGSYDIWVTLAPQVKDKCRMQAFRNGTTIESRLEQLLGLKPNSNYQSFVEFWVRPKDLFRPCPDPDISNSSCGLSFPPTVSPSHRTWIENERATNNYPWTQLGYTYDWNEKSGNRVGLSEFVIRQNTDIVIADIKPTAEYCSR